MGTIFAIETRKYACFCDFCINVDGCRLDQCENDGYVEQWKYVPLIPKGPHPISTWEEMHTEEAMVSLDHDRVSDVVREGDVFVVIAPPNNEENVAYYLMRCTQIKSRLVRPYQDGDFTYQSGDLVVMGHFFEKVKKQGDYIIYRDFMPDYISCQYSHLVVAARIHLSEIKVKKGEPRRWKMAIADHDRIMETCIPISHWPEE
jgi:hypothetical protein